MCIVVCTPAELMSTTSPFSSNSPSTRGLTNPEAEHEDDSTEARPGLGRLLVGLTLACSLFNFLYFLIYIFILIVSLMIYFDLYQARMERLEGTDLLVDPIFRAAILRSFLSEFYDAGFQTASETDAETRQLFLQKAPSREAHIEYRRKHNGENDMSRVFLNELDTAPLTVSWMAGIVDAGRATEDTYISKNVKVAEPVCSEWQDNGKTFLAVISVKGHMKNFSEIKDAKERGMWQVMIKLDMMKPKYLTVTTADCCRTIVTQRLQDAQRMFQAKQAGSAHTAHPGGEHLIRFIRRQEGGRVDHEGEAEADRDPGGGEAALAGGEQCVHRHEGLRTPSLGSHERDRAPLQLGDPEGGSGQGCRGGELFPRGGCLDAGGDELIFRKCRRGVHYPGAIGAAWTNEEGKDRVQEREDGAGVTGSTLCETLCWEVVFDANGTEFDLLKCFEYENLEFLDYGKFETCWAPELSAEVTAVRTPFAREEGTRERVEF